MPSDGPSPAPPRPSVFISYSSDDRVAARALRDTLAAVGLEVWYDEAELGGGDSWDQKLRRQIRECDYFMPVISASTERRKEGYFRREWRLASERTMDMADDVLFLLPVVIDDTSESGARVPDKFLTVQWLRTPGGLATPALEALMQRLLRGEHTVAPRPPAVNRSGATQAPFASATQPPFTNPTQPPFTPPPVGSAPPVAAAEQPSGPPPMPPFPHHVPNSGHWPRFLAEVLWWFVTAGWLLFTRLPKFFRIILAVWFVITLFGMCKTTSNSSNPNRRERPERERPEASAAARHNERDLENTIKNISEQTAEAIKAANKDGKGTDFSKLGEEMARRLNNRKKGGGGGRTSGKSVVVVPFFQDQQDPVAAKFAQAAFSACYGQLVIARPSETSIATLQSGTQDDAALLRIARDASATFVLSASTAHPAEGAAQLAVRLLQTADGTVVWSAEFPVVASEANATGGKIAEAVLTQMPPRPPEPPGRPPRP